MRIGDVRHTASRALVIGLGLLVAQFPGAAQGPGGRGGAAPPDGPPLVIDIEAMTAERPVVRQFDADKNGRLDAPERREARQWLAAQPNPLALMAGRMGGGRGFEPTSAGRRLAPAAVRSYGGALLYDTGTLRTFFLQFESDDWEQELADFYRTDVEVPATVVVDGKTYNDVGIHFRGMSSFMAVPKGSKRSLNLSFTFVHDDQRVLGYRTLNLLNVMNDPTFVRGMLYGEIARSYIPAPRTNYSRVVINGESWGIYLNAQQFNSDFTRDWFGSRDGARWTVPGSPLGRGGMNYLGEDPSAYRGTYEIKTKDDAKSWADLIRLFRVLNETPAARLESALAPLLDIDGALKFLALDVALVNTDGYWTRASDYDIYQDSRGRFHVIPHDMNEGLMAEGGGGGGRAGGGRGGGGPQLPPGIQLAPGFTFPATMGMAGVDLDPLVGVDDASRPLRSKLLAVPALRARYLGYVREIAQTWLDWGKLGPIVQRYQALVADDVMADARKLHSVAEFRSRVGEGEESLKSFAERRRAFLLK